MFSGIASALASLSLALKQPLTAYCDLETTHDDALITKGGHYCTWLRVDGMQRMAERKDYDAITEAMRLDLSGALENKGHAIVGWYISDPDAALVEIERVNLASCRAIAREVGLDLHDILNERAILWPKLMRWEAAYFQVWTRTSVLTKEERKQLKAEYAANARQGGGVTGTQRFYLRSEVMAARHTAFVSRVQSTLRAHDVAVSVLEPHDALRVAREAMYREMSGSDWVPSLPGDKVMARCPEDGARPDAGCLLWPPIRDQVFYADAVTRGGQRVDFGDNAYSPVDMNIGPEDPRPFVELAAILGQDRIPWRASIIIEGCGQSAMQIKDVGASFLSMFPGNSDLRRAFAFIRQARQEENHIAVRLRASFATWAPVEEGPRLRRRVSMLSQRIEGWGNAKSTMVIGDPLEGVMSTAPGLSLTSTANPSLALLGDALAMLPWNRTASPWESGSVLFRRPDGGIWPYDPAGGRKRPLVVDIFVAPPGSGKSVLANTINIGLCLSSAVMGTNGAKLPLIGKADIGRSAEGFVRLVQEALGPNRKHEAIFVSMQIAPGFEFNPFDLQVGCERPLPLEKAFLQNFLALATLPPDQSTPFEGMTQLISIVIDEAYRLCTEGGGGAKRYTPGVDPEVDATIDRYGIKLDEEQPYWRDVVNELCDRGEFRVAERAQRHAVPILEDLIGAVRTDQVRDMFDRLKLVETSEKASQIFERYISDTIRRYPTLNAPTQLDFGPARIIVLDLQYVAPTGSAAANRQTEMMYLLARHILARNFFLHPEYLVYVPERVKEFHRKRFLEIYETLKRVDYDEWHRTQGSALVRAQAELDVREGRKHNVQLGFASQRLSDMGDGVIAQSTGRFVLGADDQRERDEIIKRFGLTDASAKIVRNRLTGPRRDGAPFLAVMRAEQAHYEQFLINSLGPVELWALSTTPSDTSLRNRLYDRVGFSEGLRRLSKVFPNGSAADEIERRTKARLKKGDAADRVESGVVDELASELIEGRGLGLVLRPHDESPPPSRAAAAPTPALHIAAE
jgi:intracellular multiplication protein IcmB